MKKHLLFFAAILLLVGCSNEKSPEVLNLESMRDSLLQVNNQRDETINEYIKALNEIDENLQSIKEKEKIITLTADSNNEISVDQKTKINEDINMIYDILKKNEKKIKDLQKQLKNSDLKISELNKMIASLTKQLEDKNIEINLLKDHLASLNIEIEILTKNIDSLSIDNAKKDDVIDSKTDELNTAYYVYGTKKELIEHQVITKEGGFVGLGKIVKLMADFNKDYFTKIDIRETKEISLNFKKAQLVTNHPSGSYRFKGTEKVEDLEITNVSDFWASSKYLVILVE